MKQKIMRYSGKINNLLILNNRYYIILCLRKEGEYSREFIDKYLDNNFNDKFQGPFLHKPRDKMAIQSTHPPLPSHTTNRVFRKNYRNFIVCFIGAKAP